MTPAAVALVEWIRDQAERAEHLLAYDLSEGPRSYFLQSSSTGATQFYARVDLWRRWVSALIIGLRHRIEHPDHLVRDAEQRFAVDQLLVVRLVAREGEAKRFDLGDQSRHAIGDGWLDARTWFERGRAEPMWKAVTDTLVRQVRSFATTVAEQAHELRLREPNPVEPSPTLSKLGRPRYACIKKLGAGIYGEAWRARDCELERDIVVKFLRSTGAGRKDAVEAARALARVTDPNIVVVFDVAEVSDPVTSRVLDAVIMELVDGPSLVDRMVTSLLRDEAFRTGTAVLNAVAAYRAHGLIHSDLHAGNVIVGDRVVKVIDPMYIETIAVKATGAREDLQQRELRQAKDILVAMLRVTDVEMDAVIEFERRNFHLDLVTLRETFTSVLESPISAETASGSDNDALVPRGFDSDPLGDIGRTLLGCLAMMGDGQRRGHGGLLDLKAFSKERKLPLQQVRDAADLLVNHGFVTRQRMAGLLQLTRAGREEAHRLGMYEVSPNADYQALLTFLASYGEGESRGTATLDETLVVPALGFNRFRLLDAGDLLRTNQTGDMLVTMGGPIRVSLSAQGRQVAGRSAAADRRS